MGDCSYIESADCERDNLGDIVKRKHCDVIKAWADGAAIQIKTNFGEWLDKAGDPLWMDCYEYRVKPETVRYRVSLHRSPTGQYYNHVVNDAYQEKDISAFSNFVRWITDWQEVEV